MATKTVFQTDPNGWYVGAVQADESPLEPGVWHIPGGCVELAPPTVIPAGKQPQWTGSAWALNTPPAPAVTTSVTDSALAAIQAMQKQMLDLQAQLAAVTGTMATPVNSTLPTGAVISLTNPIAPPTPTQSAPEVDFSTWHDPAVVQTAEVKIEAVTSTTTAAENLAETVAATVEPAPPAPVVVAPVVDTSKGTAADSTTTVSKSNDAAGATS